MTSPREDRGHPATKSVTREGAATVTIGPISRRSMLQGSAALVGLAFLRLERLVEAAPLQPDEELVPWLDQRAETPAPARERAGQQLVWEELDSWITPNDKFFTIKHFGQPDVNMQAWRLDV